MFRADMFRIMADDFTKMLEIHQKAQKEYTLKDEAFDNFNRLAENLGIDRRIVLWVYLQKHLDGIMNYLRGHESQRESIDGRIHDAIVYLCILHGMIIEDRMPKQEFDLPEFREQDCSNPVEFGIKAKVKAVDFDDPNYKNPFERAGMPTPSVD